jgi:polyisoprenoid-binding protein YceI
VAVTRAGASLLSCLLVLALAGPALAAAIDAAQSQVGFVLKTRWGQSLEGRFPTLHGEVRSLADGRRQVQMVLSTRDVEIVGHRSYTRLTRGKGFFDADQYPEVTFVSEPYGEELTRNGGELRGVLSIRGVQRREAFTLAPATCDRPGLDCDVVAHGTVQRGDYGVDRWSFALSEVVRFSLRIRTRDGGA